MADPLLDDFLELCVVMAPSGREGRMAKAVQERLASMGLEAREDGAAGPLGGETGNLLVEVAPEHPERWITLAAHLDAVPPGGAADPYLDGGVVRTRGEILAADDRAGVAILLGLLREIAAHPLTRLGVQVLFTPSEEAGHGGASLLDPASLRGEFAVVLDTGGPPGQVNNQSPFARTFSAAYTGRSAHAGIEPEKGVNALVLASRLACALPSGRVDAETTFSFTRMESGTASNVVPERALLRGEVRSYSEAALNDLLSSLTTSAKTLASVAGATVEVTSEPMFPPFHIPEETPWVRRLFAAAEAEGFRPFAKRSGGGSDANTLNDLGLPAVNIGVGYRKGHSPEEHLIVEEFLGTYRWILRFLKGLDLSN